MIGPSSFYTAVQCAFYHLGSKEIHQIEQCNFQNHIDHEVCTKKLKILLKIQKFGKWFIDETFDENSASIYSNFSFIFLIDQTSASKLPLWHHQQLESHQSSHIDAIEMARQMIWPGFFYISSSIWHFLNNHSHVGSSLLTNITDRCRSSNSNSPELWFLVWRARELQASAPPTADCRELRRSHWPPLVH